MSIGAAEKTAPAAAQTADRAELTDTTVLERRPGVAAVFEPRDNVAALLSAYHEMQGPASIAPALQFVCRHRRFRVGHLPGLRDAASRAVLARRLVREGFLRRAADQSAGDPAAGDPAIGDPAIGEPAGPSAGSLIVAGSGIMGFAQMTVETLGYMEQADVLLYCVADPATGAWIRERYPASIDLGRLYDRYLSRFDVYDAMVEAMLAPVREGKRVCSLYYGHPGVFVMPTHRAVAQARAEGFPARMLPGVSATDCLYAELGSDPTAAGCQYYEATDLLVHRRPLHPENNVVIWQIGMVGNTTSRYDQNELQVLVEYLTEVYPPDCEVLHYQGSVFPGCDSVVERLPLAEIGQGARVSTMSTLYIPAQKAPTVDLEMAWRLGMVKDGTNSAAGDAEKKPQPPAAAGNEPREPRFGKLVEFFYDCARNPGLLLELDRDPQGTAARAGLSADETTALLSRMPGRIWAAIEAG